MHLCAVRCTAFFICIANVLAIPYVNLQRPKIIKLDHGKQILMGRPDILKSDALCQFAYNDWWEAYKQRRYRVLIEQTYRVWYYHLDYTRYPIPTPSKKDAQATATMSSIPRPPVPVEAIFGENFAQTDDDGAAPWRRVSWGCMTGCQDLEKTQEWVIATKLTRARHVRARWPFIFNCPEDMISIVTQEPSIREKETPEELQQAMEILAEVTTEHQIVRDQQTRDGDTADLVSKCNCVPKTQENFQEAMQQVRAREVIDSTFKFGQPVQRPRGVPHARTSKKKPAPTQTSTPEIEPEEPEANGKRQRTGEVAHQHWHVEVDDEFTLEDLGLNVPEPMTCYDFDYPEVGVAMTTPEEPRPDTPLAPDDEDLTEVLMATLSHFSGFDSTRDWWNDVIPRDPGPSKDWSP